MARQRKGILDGFSGSVRNLTGQKKNGQNIIRSKPSKPNPSKSTEQAKTRSDFAKAVDLYQLFRRSEFDKLWAAKDDSKTQLNNFISANIGTTFPIGAFQSKNIFGRYKTTFNRIAMSGFGPSGFRSINFFPIKSAGEDMPNPNDIIVAFVYFIDRGQVLYQNQSFIAEWGPTVQLVIFTTFLPGELCAVGHAIIKPDYSDYFATKMTVFKTT